MERTTDLVTPYRVQLVHDEADRLVGVNVRATDGGELTEEIVIYALRNLRGHLMREKRRAQIAEDPAVLPTEKLHTQVSPHLLKVAYDESPGKLSDRYLALLSRAYSELVANRSNAVEYIASSLGDPPIPDATVRTHIKRAREDGFLTPTRQGKAHGEITAKTRKVLGLAES